MNYGILYKKAKKRRIMTTRMCNLIERLPDIASKSEISHQHGAVLVKNGVPLIYAFNKINGGRTVHAEHNAIRRYLAGQGLKCGERHSCLLRNQCVEGKARNAGHQCNSNSC